MNANVIGHFAYDLLGVPQMAERYLDFIGADRQPAFWTGRMGEEFVNVLLEIPGTFLEPRCQFIEDRDATQIIGSAIFLADTSKSIDLLMPRL